MRVDRNTNKCYRKGQELDWDNEKARCTFEKNKDYYYNLEMDNYELINLPTIFATKDWVLDYYSNLCYRKDYLKPYWMSTVDYHDMVNILTETHAEDFVLCK
jgi:hypothetical protein